MASSSPFAFLETGHEMHQEETFQTIGDKDCIFGRGGKSYGHPGNRLFRRLVFHNKDLYESLRNPTQRQFIALSIVRSIQRSGGKFMKKVKGNQDLWKTVSTKEACIKTSQALRDANVRTKRESKVGCSKHSEVIDREQAVVSPTYSSELPPQLVRKVTQPDVSELKPATEPSSSESNFNEIDHIEMETIHTLMRSLGGNVGSRMQSQLSNATQQSPQIKQAQRQTDAYQSSSSRLSFTVRDWMSKQASNDSKLPPSTYRSSSFRCSITSVSMLDPSLFSADFDLEDFEIDEALATEV
ncbi:MAG: hypothetical protein SGILL_007039 [Bacillariaceae sp.]